MSQIIPIVSEALQNSIRRLLPSQSGFGEDLQASNVILPIIDLTPVAEGSSLPSNLQQAVSFGNNEAFSVANATTVLTTTTGFWRIIGTSTTRSSNAGVERGLIRVSDGFAVKNVWEFTTPQSATNLLSAVTFDFVVFLAAGESMSIVADTNNVTAGSIRQVASINGTLISPVGFVVE